MLKVSDYFAADREAALKEKLCIHACLERVEVNTANGDFMNAREALIDAMKSVNEMDKLRQKKLAHDKFTELSYLMTQNKVPLQSVILIKQT